MYINLHSEDDSKRLPLRCTFLIEFIIIKKVFFPSPQSGIGIKIEPTVFFFLNLFEKKQEDVDFDVNLMYVSVTFNRALGEFL